MHEVVGQRDEQDAGEHHYRPVHAFRLNGRRYWKADEDDGEARVGEGEEIDRKAEFAERPARWWKRLAANTLQCDATDRDGVCAHQSEELERDDGVAMFLSVLPHVHVSGHTYKATVLPRLIKESRIVKP